MAGRGETLMIDVCLAGTGGMMPLKNRWLTCLWAEYQGKAVLIDCGEGTQIALAESGLKMSKLDAIFLTHIHADHIAGLPGLLLSLGNCGKADTLNIYGPEGVIKAVESLCYVCPFLPFGIEVSELRTDEITKLTRDDITVTFLPLQHRIPCLGYSFTLKRKPVFNPDKATELEIPQKLWNRLHSGENVELDGRTITPDMVTDEERKPLKLTYITDSVYCGKMIPFAENSDLLICEGMYGDDDNIEKMTEKCHMVFSDSARIAAAANVKELWLTHYSPALANPEDYAESVRSIFPNTVISRDGQKTTLK